MNQHERTLYARLAGTRIDIEPRLNECMTAQPVEFRFHGASHGPMMGLQSLAENVLEAVSVDSGSVNMGSALDRPIRVSFVPCVSLVLRVFRVDGCSRLRGW